MFAGRAAGGLDRRGAAATAARPRSRPTRRARRRSREPVGGPREAGGRLRRRQRRARRRERARRRRVGHGGVELGRVCERRAGGVDRRAGRGRRGGEGHGRSSAGVDGAATRSAATRRASRRRGRRRRRSTARARPSPRCPRSGRSCGRGQSLYAISGEPVVLLYGSVAAVAAFAAGMSAGRDVAELNANLRALGYGTVSTGEQVHRGDGGGDPRVPVGARPRPDRASCCSARSCSSRGGARDERDADGRRDGAARAGADDHLDRPAGHDRARRRRSRPSQGRRSGHDHAARQRDDARGRSRTSAPWRRRLELERRAAAGRRRLEHSDDRGRRHPDRSGRDRSARPGAGQRLDHDRHGRGRARRAGRLRCWRSPAAATRSRRSAPTASTTWWRSPSGCSTTPRPRPGEGSGLAAGQRVVVPGEMTASPCSSSTR